MNKNRIKTITINFIGNDYNNKRDYAQIVIIFENGLLLNRNYDRDENPYTRVQRVLEFTKRHSWIASVEVGVTSLDVTFENPLIYLAQVVRDEGYDPDSVSDYALGLVRKEEEDYHSQAESDCLSAACHDLKLARLPEEIWHEVIDNE